MWARAVYVCGLRYETHCADEALWMPGAIGSSQVVVPHRLSTAWALGSKEVVEVLVTVRFPILLQETWDRQKIYWTLCWTFPSERNVFLSLSLSCPNSSPQYAQKKCSGCQVWSRAVRMFCKTSQRCYISIWLPLMISKVYLISRVQMSGNNTKMWIVDHKKGIVEDVALVSG